MLIESIDEGLYVCITHEQKGESIIHFFSKFDSIHDFIKLECILCDGINIHL
jgi:hypothetical protein